MTPATERLLLRRTSMSGAAWYSADGVNWYASPEAATLASSDPDDIECGQQDETGDQER